MQAWTELTRHMLCSTHVPSFCLLERQVRTFARCRDVAVMYTFVVKALSAGFCLDKYV